MIARPNPLRFLPDPGPAMRCVTTLVPTPLLNKIAQSTLNLLFAGALKSGELAFLQDRTVRVNVTDMALDLSITTRRHQLLVHKADHQEDVTFSAEFAALVEIITAQTDPDTLFFHRRLSISGDTELGLSLKNFLDSCEPAEIIPRPVYQMLRYYQAKQPIGIGHS